MYKFIHITIYIYMYISMYMSMFHFHVPVHVQVHEHKYMNTCTCTHVHVLVHVHMYMYTCTCTHVHVHVHAHIYMNTYNYTSLRMSTYCSHKEHGYLQRFSTICLCSNTSSRLEHVEIVHIAGLNMSLLRSSHPSPFLYRFEHLIDFNLSLAVKSLT